MFVLIIITMGLLGPVPETQAETFLNIGECQQAYLMWELTHSLPPFIYRDHECIRSV